MQSLFVLVFLVSLFEVYEQRSTTADDHYVAAVVEYEVSRNDEQNTLRYIQLIADAARQNADIVVFPEMTLNNGSTSTVPFYGLLQTYPIPALNPTYFDSLLVTMSQAALTNQVYVVINIRELVDCTLNNTGEYCPERKQYIFNTNVVFDRTGAVIDRYRKITLFGEVLHTPALRPELGIFKTDFGVTFGHFICFDLMFQVPAIQVVQKHHITDVIFTTMWYSELPYVTAVQIQEAYAHAMGVNFLAAGANNVGYGTAGSGIYSGTAGALVSIMPGTPTTRLLVARVPKTPGMVVEPVTGPIYDNPAVHDNLRLIADSSLPSHVSRVLNDGLNDFTLTDRDVSCSFRVRLTHRIGDNRYRYRALAFSGVRSFLGEGTGGIRVCSIVACTGHNINTCGHRFQTYAVASTAVFQELSIQATFPASVYRDDLQCYDSAVFPVSVKSNIMTLEPRDYNFSLHMQANITMYNIALTTFNHELYSIGIWGRVYATDGQNADPPRGSAVRSFVSGVLLLPGLAVLLLR